MYNLNSPASNPLEIFVEYPPTAMKTNVINIRTSLLTVALSVASLGIPVAAKADTVNARCDVYPAGQDRATYAGPCTFSQRQGAVGIQLQAGKRYDLRPDGSHPGNYIDQSGRAAYRQAGLGSSGQIYRLATESVYVYWDSAPYNQANNPTTRPVAPRRGLSTLRASDPGARINVRSEPTIDSPSPHYGVPGDKVEVLRCVNDRDIHGSGLNWCDVRFVQSGATGWVRSDFIIFADGGE